MGRSGRGGSPLAFCRGRSSSLTTMTAVNDCPRFHPHRTARGGLAHLHRRRHGRPRHYEHLGADATGELGAAGGARVANGPDEGGPIRQGRCACVSTARRPASTGWWKFSARSARRRPTMPTRVRRRGAATRVTRTRTPTRNSLPRPNNDGPIQRCSRDVAFTSVQTIDFWPDGSAHTMGATVPIGGTGVTLAGVRRHARHVGEQVDHGEWPWQNHVAVAKRASRSSRCWPRWSSSRCRWCRWRSCSRCPRGPTSRRAATRYAALLAQQKMEQLRGLTWGFDILGLPVSDSPPTPLPARRSRLRRRRRRRHGPVAVAAGARCSRTRDGLRRLRRRQRLHPRRWRHGAAGRRGYIRRWSVEPLPTNPNNTLVLQVLVTRRTTAATADCRQRRAPARRGAPDQRQDEEDQMTSRCAPAKRSGLHAARDAGLDRDHGARHRQRVLAAEPVVRDVPGAARSVRHAAAAARGGRHASRRTW